ncbi:MAG: hypothetical protein EON90_13255 [Brevundimonas sp.]|nr:MAG: hypothetical protein EON90_13255 [Brevundimonas sp.]
MGPYTLTVFHKGNPVPTETAHASRAPEVLNKIQALLKKHDGCERIRVSSLTAHLFTVDCHGNTVDD